MWTQEAGTWMCVGMWTSCSLSTPGGQLARANPRLGKCGGRGQEDKPREAGGQLNSAISSLWVVSDISALNAGWRIVLQCLLK